MTPDHIDFERLKNELQILDEHARERRHFAGEVRRVARSGSDFPNPRRSDEIGVYRRPESRKLVTADFDLLERFREAGLAPPTFPAAGPRARLAFDPAKVRAAVVTTGGIAPGLNSVVHSVVERHFRTYGTSRARGGIVLGIHDGFRGLLDVTDHMEELDPATTLGWLAMGGSQLGSVRYSHPPGDGGLGGLVAGVTENLARHNIDILYVIGGDGTQLVAHQLALANPARVVMGIPKTMDNDLLWVWESFGFDTVVGEATKVINTLHFEAQSTRRVCIIKFFGAASGFVVSNASLASGQVDLVLVPETLSHLAEAEFDRHWNELMQHVAQRVVENGKTPHAVIVMAEGVEKLLAQRGLRVAGELVSLQAEGTSGNLITLLQREISERVVSSRGRPIGSFVNEPRHYIRSVPANAHDQIYCERLGALAVDNALAGYTDCMVSLWLTESVLVPLELVIAGKKCIPPTGMFWRQVVSATGQPQAPGA